MLCCCGHHLWWWRGRHNNTRPYGQGISSGLYLLIKSCHCHQPLCSYTSPCSSVTHAHTHRHRTDTARYGRILIYEGKMRLDEQLSHWSIYKCSPQTLNCKEHCTEFLLSDYEPFCFSKYTVIPQKCYERSNESCFWLMISFTCLKQTLLRREFDI